MVKIFQGRQVIRSETLQDALAYDRQIKKIKRMNQRQEQKFPNSGEFLSKIRKEDYIQPVITLVVYWGEAEWQGGRVQENGSMTGYMVNEYGNSG